MLNIKELDKKFYEILSSFTEEKVEEWIKFSEERDALESLMQGEFVAIDIEKLKATYLKADSIPSDYNQLGEINYALAA